VKTFRRGLVMVAVLGVIAAQGLALSPPWWTFYHTFMGTIGRDQTLHIPLMTEIDDGHYQIDVYVEGEDADEVGPALAGLVGGDHDFGGVALMVRVWTPDGDAIMPAAPDAAYDPVAFLKDMVNTAFRHNPLFVEAILGGYVGPFIPDFPDVIAILEPEVVEYWNDDLSDWFQYRHLIAQDAFAEVVNTDYFDGGASLGFTTDPRRH
jgi:hypothetical protein